jgi:hypothetical protein
MFDEGVTSVKVHYCEGQLTQASAIHLSEDCHFKRHFDLEMQPLATRVGEQEWMQLLLPQDLKRLHCLYEHLIHRLEPLSVHL